MTERTARQKLASRLVYGSFLGLAAAFILSSAFQLIVSVFGLGIEPLAAPGAGAGQTVDSHPHACTEGIASLSAALDRSFAHAAGPDPTAGAAGEPASEEALLANFRKNLEPEWAEERKIEESCMGQPRGRDAFAALLRLKLAEEGFVRRQMVEIDPLRRSVQAYLPH
ncbi:hypothetical protein [Pendulispora albinea]|uniref:Uncharacterized protein n=1 Tax=Pendulispora albinea TaxID=2741071 RepID=A0ABZ2LJQ1_9BACT